MQRLMWSLAAVALTAACGEATTDLGPSADAGVVADAGSGPVDGQILPDFSLVDTNPTSAFAGLAVSPRQFMEQATGWYFTEAS